MDDTKVASPEVGSPTSMSAFFTRGAANAGVRVPLTAPDGSRTEHWLQVLGLDSDAFREADVRGQRETAALVAEAKQSGAKSLDSLTSGMQDIKRRTLAALVVGWSFDEPCTPENVENFFREAPQIMDMVDRLAGSRALFFAMRSSS